MKKYRYFIIGGLLLAALLLARNWSGMRRPPNLLLITMDTTRADRLGCYAFPDALTPALDGLAAGGTLFEQAETCVPITLPSHTTMLTGLYPPESGIRVNGAGKLSPSIPLLSEILQLRGYRTGAFVAASVLHSQYGLNRGFDFYDDRDTLPPKNGDAHAELYRPANRVVDSALEWLSRHRLNNADGKPFFCWVHLFDPHTPLHSHSDLFGKRFKNDYDAEIAFMDIHIGRLLDFLKRNRLAGNTLVVAVGDHGEGLGEHDETTHGYMLYDSTLRVPLIISRPGSIPAGRRVQGMVSLTGLFPTILELLKVDPFAYRERNDPRNALIERILKNSFAPAVSSGEAARADFYAETDHPYYNYGWSPLRALVTPEWKYIRAPEPELYDRTADPHETRSLARENPSLVEQMDGRLADLEARMIRHASDAVSLTAEEMNRLQSLGYMAGGGGQVSEGLGVRTDLADIKDRIGIVDLASEIDSRMKYEQGNSEQVLNMCRELIARSPDTPVFRLWMGLLLANRKDYDAALESLDRAIQLFDEAIRKIPSDLRMVSYMSSAWDKKGLVLSMQKKHEQAEKAFRLALAYEPENTDAHHHLGLALLELGRREEGLQSIREALRIDPDFELARTNLDKALSETGSNE